MFIQSSLLLAQWYQDDSGTVSPIWYNLSHLCSFVNFHLSTTCLLLRVKFFNLKYFYFHREHLQCFSWLDNSKEKVLLISAS